MLSDDEIEQMGLPSRWVLIKKLYRHLPTVDLQWRLLSELAQESNVAFQKLLDVQAQAKENPTKFESGLP